MRPFILCASIVAISTSIHAAPRGQTKDATKSTKAADPLVGNPAARPDAPIKKAPVGVWVRDVTVNGNKVKITLNIKDDRLIISYGDKNYPSFYVLDCDYGVTKDFVLFGVVNSVDGEPSERPTDKPFRFRYRIDEEALTIKDGLMENCPGIVSRLEGRYTLSKK